MKYVASVSVLLLIVSAGLKAQSVADMKAPSSPADAELVSLTNAWTDAINTKDRSKLDQLMSPDFTLQGWDGDFKVERAKWLDNLFHVISLAEYHHSAILPHIYGNVAAVTSRWYWRGTRGTTDKKPFEEHGYVVDMWQRAGGRWRVVSRISIIVPGKGTE